MQGLTLAAFNAAGKHTVMLADVLTVRNLKSYTLLHAGVIKGVNSKACLKWPLKNCP